MHEKIKKRMVELGISVKELCKHTGISDYTIYSILEGKTKRCQMKTYKLLAQYLKCKVSDLID